MKSEAAFYLLPRLFATALRKEREEFQATAVKVWGAPCIYAYTRLMNEPLVRAMSIA